MQACAKAVGYEDERMEGDVEKGYVFTYNMRSFGVGGE